jgi:hypothetical protein
VLVLAGGAAFGLKTFGVFGKTETPEKAVSDKPVPESAAGAPPVRSAEPTIKEENLPRNLESNMTSAQCKKGAIPEANLNLPIKTVRRRRRYRSVPVHPLNTPGKSYKDGQVRKMAADKVRRLW